MPAGPLNQLRSRLSPFGPPRLEGWLRLLSIAVIVGCAVLITTFSFGRDQGIYATVGAGMLSGKVPYRDLWDFKPPGIFLIFSGAEALFGHTMAAPRIVEAIGLVTMAVAMSQLSERWYGSATPGWLGAAIAAIVHLELDFWHSGQPESFGGFLAIYALWLISYSRRPAWRPALWAVAGVAIGFSALLKPPLGGVGIVVFAYLLRQSEEFGRRQLLVGLGALAAGAVLPLGLCFSWFWARGGWSAMVWTLRDFVPGYTALGWQGDHRALEMFYFASVEALTRFSALIAVGAIAALMLPVVTEREQSSCFLLLGCCIVQVTGIALQAKFFQYHYGATIPLLSLLAGLGWYKLWLRAWLRRPSAPMVFGVAAIGALLMRKPVKDVPGTVPERSSVRAQFLLGRGENPTREKMDAALHLAADYDLASDRRVAAYILAHTKPTDSILIWGFEPVIYWITNRRPATRFIYDVPQRSQWQTAVSQRLFIQEVEQNQPTIIVVQHNDVFPGVTGRMSDSAADLERFDALDAYLDDFFVLATTIDDFDLYRRKTIE